MATTLTALPLPPHITVNPARPIPVAQALSLIQQYLHSSESAPHLHPDCIFTEHGPTFSSASSTGGLVLHQLRRVEAGLRGERLGAEPDVLAELPDGDDGRLDEQAQITIHNSNDDANPEAQQDAFLETEEGTGDNTHPPSHGETFRATPTQFQKTYTEQMAEQHIGDIVDDYAERSNVVGDAGHGAYVPTVHATKRGHEGETLSREARKAAKKARMKDERRAAGGVRASGVGVGVGAGAKVEDEEGETEMGQDELEMPVSAVQVKTWRGDGVGAMQANADLDAMDVDMPDVETLAAEIGAQRTTAAGLESGIGQVPSGKVVSQAEGMLSEQAEKDIAGEPETKEQRRARKKAKREARGEGGNGDGVVMASEETGGGFDVASRGKESMKKEKRKKRRESEIVA